MKPGSLIRIDYHVDRPIPAWKTGVVNENAPTPMPLEVLERGAIGMVMRMHESDERAHILIGTEVYDVGMIYVHPLLPPAPTTSETRKPSKDNVGE